MSQAPPLLDSAPAPLRFQPGYRETIRLRDGRQAHVFPLSALHGPNLLRGFAQLSPRSRYLRFVSLRSTLSEAQVRYLTAIDGLRHFALAATVVDSGGCHEAAIARFVQLPDAPDTVEIAITVVDVFQGLGLGSQLLQRLMEAARERGYTRVRAEFLSENRVVLKLLRTLGQPLTFERQGTATVAWAPLGSSSPAQALRAAG